jgi:hypothetical protein
MHPALTSSGVSKTAWHWVAALSLCRELCCTEMCTAMNTICLRLRYLPLYADVSRAA